MDKTPLLLSTAYMPPVSWFALLLKHPVQIEQFETYQRQSYRNRCLIYSERGVLPLSLPVSRPNGNHTLISEVRIFNTEKWYRNHRRALQSAYEASPFYLYYKDELAEFFSGSFDNLFEFNQQLIRRFCTLLNIKPVISYTKAYQKHPKNVHDLRHCFSPKKQAAGFFPEYIQVFSDRHGFLPDLSIVDLLFNLGPESKNYLSKINPEF